MPEEYLIEKQEFGYFAMQTTDCFPKYFVGHRIVRIQLKTELLP